MSRPLAEKTRDLLLCVALASAIMLARSYAPGSPLPEVMEGYEVAQDVRTNPPLLGLDGIPIPTGSQLFFRVYPSPLPFSDRAGEPSLSVDWTSHQASLIMGNRTARVSWDDASIKPVAHWIDTTPLLLAQLGTQDPFLASDMVTGRTLVASMLFGSSYLLFSDDEGGNWSLSEPVLSLDHPVLSFGAFHEKPPVTLFPSAAYLCGQGVVVVQCMRSLDGGRLWEPPVPVEAVSCVDIERRSLFGDPLGSVSNPWHGIPAVGPDGMVYVPLSLCPIDGSRVQAVSIGDGALNWKIHAIPDSLSTGALQAPGVAVDAANNLYMAWSQGDASLETHAGPLLAKVRLAGGQWSPTVDVGAPFEIKRSVFPAVAAGDAGRAAVAFLGTPSEGDPEDCAAEPEWRLYVSFTFDAGTTWTTTEVTPTDDVQRGGIHLEGVNGAQTCRNLLDFIGIAFDGEGRVVAAFADGCISLECTRWGGTSADSRNAWGTIARQMGGPTLRAKHDPAPPQPLEALTRGAGKPNPEAQVDAAAIGGLPPYAFSWDLDDDGSYDDAMGPSAMVSGSPRNVRVLVTDSLMNQAVGEARVSDGSDSLQSFSREYALPGVEARVCFGDDPPTCPGLRNDACNLSALIQPSPTCVVFQVPSGATSVHVRIRDWVQPHVGALLCIGFCQASNAVEFCDEIELTLNGADILHIPFRGPVVPFPCEGEPGLASTGTVYAEFLVR